MLTEKPPQSNSRLMKIWVKSVRCCFKLPKKPLLLRHPGYAPDHSAGDALSESEMHQINY